MYFIFLCQHISACLKLNRSRLLIVYCYNKKTNGTAAKQTDTTQIQKCFRIQVKFAQTELTASRLLGQTRLNFSIKMYSQKYFKYKVSNFYFGGNLHLLDSSIFPLLCKILEFDNKLEYQPTFLLVFLNMTRLEVRQILLKHQQVFQKKAPSNT